MEYKFIIPVLIAFGLSVILGPVVIPLLRKLKMGQTEREEGVQSHLQKQGTPTMGGVIILTSIVVTSLFFIKDNPEIIPIVFMTLGFGLIGFLDDYLKVVLKRSDGLFPLQKTVNALQVVMPLRLYSKALTVQQPMSELMSSSKKLHIINNLKTVWE